MSGHRQAALALYSLSTADQDLILASLPDADQAQLRSYLAELSELGFEGAAPAPALAPLRLFSPALSPPAAPHEWVRDASPHAIAELLGSEPAGLVAQVLACQDWPWHAQLLALFPPERRKLVQRALDVRCQRGAAPAINECLIGFMAERLARSAPPGPRSGWSALLTKATSWTR